jgi:hypothetical protein
LLPSYSAAKEIRVLYTSLYPGTVYCLYQNNANARDRTIALEDQSLTTLLPNVLGIFDRQLGRAISVIKRASKDVLRGDIEVKTGLSEPLVIARTSLKEGFPLKQ